MAANKIETTGTFEIRLFTHMDYSHTFKKWDRMKYLHSSVVAGHGNFKCVTLSESGYCWEQVQYV